MRYLSDRVPVMYLGQVAELGPSEVMFNEPLHPCTKALLSSMPTLDPDHRTEVVPLAAPDPLCSVGAQVSGEAIRRHEPVSAAQAHERAPKLFERVRIPSPERRLAAYPHEMNGGMRQPAMIALALALACSPPCRRPSFWRRGTRRDAGGPTRRGRRRARLDARWAGRLMGGWRKR